MPFAYITDPEMIAEIKREMLRGYYTWEELSEEYQVPLEQIRELERNWKDE